MYKTTMTSILLGVIILPCFNQYISYNEVIANAEHVECTAAGITSFSPICSIESLDSVVHFTFQEGTDPNISSKYFYFDENSKLDSLKERFFDQSYNYTSGYTINYDYDTSGRVSDVFKASWNSSIEHLVIFIQEKYEYEDGFFRRSSNIEWQTGHDTSSVDVKEEYAYDEESQLADYTMFVPHEINPDNAIYKELYSYDSVGYLSYKSKDLSESGESLNLVETNYQNTYMEENLPWLIHATSRINGQGDWNESGSFHFIYDEMQRKTMMTETKNTDSDPVYEQRIYSYDQYNHIIEEVRYISSDSVHFQLADSILYYHSSPEEEEEEIDEEKEEEFPESPEHYEFTLFPNPTDGILHIRSGIDSPSSINVIDASGKVVLTRNLDTGIADIDMTPYPSGFYIITLTSIQGYHTGKVFKY
jgi:hypothetical protein